MGKGARREIFKRLEALERLVRSGHDDDCGGGHGRHGGHNGHHHHGGGCGGGEFQEKHVIDTIVHLVTEQVGRLLEQHQSNGRSHRDDRNEREQGGEKRIVDLIVGLVSEHVGEIVSVELDRRLGRPKPSAEGDRRPHDSPGGRRESEED